MYKAKLTKDITGFAAYGYTKADGRTENTVFKKINSLISPLF